MYQFSIALETPESQTFGITNWEVRDGFFGAPLAEMTPDRTEDARDLLIRKLSRVVLYTTDLHVSEYSSYVRFFRNAHLLGIVNVCLSDAAVAGALAGRAGPSTVICSRPGIRSASATAASIEAVSRGSSSG